MAKHTGLYIVISAIAIGLAIWICWFFLFPYLLWAKEANSFFSFTSDYYNWTLTQPNSFGVLVGDYLTQFYRFPAIGALIQALLAVTVFCVVVFILRRLRVPSWLWWIATLASVYLWHISFDEESLVKSIPYLFFFVVLALVVFALTKIKSVRSLIEKISTDDALYHRSYITVIVSVLLVSGYFVYAWHNTELKKQERWANIQFLAYTNRWDALSDMVCHQETYDNMEMPYMLLSLSHQGHLGDGIFHYPVNSEEFFLYLGVGTRDAYFFNQLWYAHLGMVNEAIHMAYQEKTRTRYPMSFRILMNLIKFETERGDYRQANKYLDLLNRSSCYKSWVEKHRPTAQQIAESNTNHSASTFFITDSTLKNLYYEVNSGSENKALHNYYLSALLIRKNLLAFVKHINEHRFVIEDGIPSNFWEAIILADAQGFHVEGLSMFPGLYERFMDFQSLLGKQDKKTIMERYRDSYWFNYYFLTFPEDTNANGDQPVIVPQS